jgi:hypothetical protein
MREGPVSLVRRFAAHGLPGGDDRLPEQVGDDDWPIVLDQLSGERLTGIALAAAQDGRLLLSELQARALVDRHRESMLVALALERRLLEVASAFEREGIDVVVLKGPALAHTFYPDPSWRCFGDLDLLVPTGRWDPALEIVREVGFSRDTPEPRPGFDVRFGKAATHSDSRGLVLDLHRTLAEAPFGLWLEPDRLFERTRPFELGGFQLRRLDDTAAFLHACVHASLGSRQFLLPLRDVGQVAAAGDVDWDVASRLAERWRLRAVVRHATESLRSKLGVELPAAALEIASGPVSRSELRALDAFSIARRDHGGEAIAAIRGLPGIRGKAAYVRALAFPERKFLAARGQRSYASRWLIPLRWVGRGRS